MTVITYNLIKSALPGITDKARPYLDICEEYFQKWGIVSDLEKVHALAQATHECGDFVKLVESFAYSKDRMVAIFPSKFGKKVQKDTNGDGVMEVVIVAVPELVEKYYGKPEDFASYVYANKNGNGDEASRDGWSYRGRCPTHLTGRANYRDTGRRIGVDLENNPDLAASDPRIGWDIFGDFWKTRKIGDPARKDNLTAVTKLINGGTIGIEQRNDRLIKLKKAFGLPYNVIPKTPMV